MSQMIFASIGQNLIELATY